MFKSKGLTLTWLIIYSIVSVWGFFASVFSLIAYSRFMTGLSGAEASTNKDILSHYFLDGIPIMIVVSLFVAWHFYGKKRYRSVWCVAPGVAIVYFVTMFIALR